jgi:hypothetical protein
LMNQLRAVGAQGELDLPRIAVIGNQSAGKWLLPCMSGGSQDSPREIVGCRSYLWNQGPKRRRNMYPVSNGVSAFVFLQLMVVSHLYPT